MPTITAIRVADSLIDLAIDKGSPITNLKLQKLLYYAQAWHLAIYSVELFPDDFEAWVHGPVVPAVFRAFRSSNWATLTPQGTISLRHEAIYHLKQVWKVYGKFSAFELERMTHSEEPWRKARKGLAPDEPSHEIISKSSIKKYYASQLS